MELGHHGFLLQSGEPRPGERGALSTQPLGPTGRPVGGGESMHLIARAWVRSLGHPVPQCSPHVMPGTWQMLSVN
jgi:hypothetical protein